MGSKQFFARKLFLVCQVGQRKTIVFLVSAMRTGSTLLKSLLAAAPDVSHLPEIDFQQYHTWNAWKLKTKSQHPIIVLKKPATFGDTTYPLLPALKNAKTIVLVRDAYATILSLERMIRQVYPQLADEWGQARLLHEYWLPVYQSILRQTDATDPDTIYLRYEDLTRFPEATTAELFRFIGSQQQTGVSTYDPPPSHAWAWGKDDGGRKIKSLQVQSNPVMIEDQALLGLINASEEVLTLRRRLGYLRPPGPSV